MCRNSRRILSQALVLLSLLPFQAFAQQTGAENSPPPCSAEEYRQFDFWIGKWRVLQNNELAGTNLITAIHDGCAIEENWRTAVAGGISGSSLNMYDRLTGTWHQSWVDSSGGLLLLNGGWNGTSMVRTGTRPATDGSGATTTHRITWTPAADGSLRQLWQTSTDGQVWNTLFDGQYRRDDGAE